MNNFISLFIATLEHLELLSEKEAKALAKELGSTTLPDTYEATSKLLSGIYKDLEIKPLRQKVKA